MGRSLLTGCAVALLLTVVAYPHAAHAQALNDPVAFWNALKVAAGGGAGQLVSGAARWVLGSFAGGGWIVGGALVVGVVGTIAYNRWKAAHAVGPPTDGEMAWSTFSNNDQCGSGVCWENVRGGYFFRVTFLSNGTCVSQDPHSDHQLVQVTYDAPNLVGQPFPSPSNFRPECELVHNSGTAATDLYNLWAWWSGKVTDAGYPYASGPAVWPGTSVQVPATIEEAMADARWSTIEDAVAAELPQAFEDRRAALGGAYPARLEDYAGSGAYGTTFSNPQAISQPGAGNPPVAGDPNAPPTAGYMQELFQWLGDLWRSQVAWLAGIIETWESRVVTELQGIKEALVTLPATLAAAVETAVTDAVEAAFVPSATAMEQFTSIPEVMATKFPFALIPPESLFADPGLSSSCALPELGGYDLPGGAAVDLEWPDFVCTAAGYVRGFMLGLMWFLVGWFVIQRLLPRVAI